PENPAVHTVNRLHQVMMIAPINAEENKTEYIAKKRRNQRTQCGQSGSSWNVQFQNHDGDNDCHHAVAKGLEAGFRHAAILHASNRVVSLGRPTSAIEDQKLPGYSDRKTTCNVWAFHTLQKLSQDFVNYCGRMSTTKWRSELSA